MAKRNLTTTPGFILLEYSSLSNLQSFLFIICLLFYVVTLMGNGLVVLLTVIDSALQTPMYFFLRNVSFVEICCTLVTLPKMLVHFLEKVGSISFIGCAAQMYFLLLLGGTERFLLAVMAYDRYVAICIPLHYRIIMDRKVCMKLVAGSWSVTIPVQLGQTHLMFSLHSCESHEINHFLCDLTPLLELSCVDTYRNRLAIIIAAVLFTITPFFLKFFFLQ